jgi:hypothetical protein
MSTRANFASAKPSIDPRSVMLEVVTNNEVLE